MEEMTCPKCHSGMSPRHLRDITIQQCSSCGGIFLDRADLGDLADAESDWHVHTGPTTRPLPRITADMTAPPPSRPAARAFIETLFA